MRRTYLIDSENINDVWVELLQVLEDEDEILVFYTDKSAHMGYDRIVCLMEQKRGTVHWIKCFEGQNALDFQLVTELGSCLSRNGSREYIIVSNDTGYDAVVRYWQQKGCSVRRIKGADCEKGAPAERRQEMLSEKALTEKSGQKASEKIPSEKSGQDVSSEKVPSEKKTPAATSEQAPAEKKGRKAKAIGGGKRDSGIHRSGVRHSTGRNERELLQDGIGVLETDSGGTSSGDPSREVRNNAQELSSQSGSQEIYMAEKQRSTKQTSDSRQSSGTRNGRYDSGKTQGEQSGIQRSGESGRLPENSATAKQFSENSRGRNSDRTDIQIIGNTPYRYIPQKTYRKYDTDIAAKIADKLGESGIKFSGKITAETTTITVSKADIERLEEIAHSFTAEKEQFAIGELKITQDDIEILRSIEPRKSILNFTAEEIKLTETWQQRFETDIHEKSPYYRALNGDWRENDESKVTVIQVEDRNVTLNSVRNDIKSQVIERGTASNIDTGWNIQISRKGLEDTVHYANKHNLP